MRFAIIPVYNAQMLFAKPCKHFHIMLSISTQAYPDGRSHQISGKRLNPLMQPGSFLSCNW